MPVIALAWSNAMNTTTFATSASVGSPSHQRPALEEVVELLQLPELLRLLRVLDSGLRDSFGP